MNGKYIKGKLLKWIRNPYKNTRNVLDFLVGFIKADPCLGKGLSWKIGKCSNVLVGIDPINGIQGNYVLYPFLWEYLVEIGFISLEHIKIPS